MTGTVDAIRIQLEAAREAQAEVVAREQAKLAQIDAMLDAARSEPVPGEAPARQDFADLGITLATKKVLDARGPGAMMTTREIADEIRKRGVVSKSKNFIPTVYATLANSDEFERKDGKWTRKRPRGERHDGTKQETHAIGSFASGAPRSKR